MCTAGCVFVLPYLCQHHSAHTRRPSQSRYRCKGVRLHIVT